jgi:hypothetical protein
MGAPLVSAWLRTALEGPVVRRGLFYAVIVGAVLIAINHGDALLRGDVEGGRLLKMGLTVLVPYLVSTFSSVAALHDRSGGGALPG